MLRNDTYILDGFPQDYLKARQRKLELKADGWRVKVRKVEDGSYQIFKKHVSIIDARRK